MILQLGEVDCGHVIWVRAEKYGQSIDAQLRASIDAYFGFVDELIESGFQRMIITGATLPTISDDDMEGEVLLARASVDASQRDRTDLTLAYNHALNDNARERGLPFVDVADDILDPATGIVDPRFKNPMVGDHHMNKHMGAIYWGLRLRPAIAHYQTLLPDRREWITVRNTVAKAYPANSQQMVEGTFRTVEKGERISGDFLGELDEYYILDSPEISGISQPILRLIHKTHVKQL
ncbi:hypothetical protein [Microbacterium lacticum]